jgi:hypothetical protein
MLVAQTPHSGRFLGVRGFATSSVASRGGGMSVTRLLLSGLLVASGLILAAFTLHGSFDARQMQASSAQGPALKPWSTNTFEAGGRLVAASAGKSEQQLPQAQPARPGPKLDGKRPGASAAAKAATAAKARRLAEKRLAEKALKAKQPPQQAALQWPWNWLGN